MEWIIIIIKCWQKYFLLLLHKRRKMFFLFWSAFDFGGYFILFFFFLIVQYHRLSKCILYIPKSTTFYDGCFFWWLRINDLSFFIFRIWITSIINFNVFDATFLYSFQISNMQFFYRDFSLNNNDTHTVDLHIIPNSIFMLLTGRIFLISFLWFLLLSLNNDMIICLNTNVVNQNHQNYQMLDPWYCNINNNG